MGVLEEASLSSTKVVIWPLSGNISGIYTFHSYQLSHLGKAQGPFLASNTIIHQPLTPPSLKWAYGVRLTHGL